MRVLFVAGWYPSSASPGRGSFVADQVRAVVGRGVEVVVASWEPALAVHEDPDDAATTWARAIERGPLPLARPQTWGAGVPVARLPAVVPGSPDLRRPADLARWQATTLVAFGRALMQVWPFDLVHAHRGLPDGVAAAALADDLGVPLLTTEHDGSLDRQLATQPAIDAYRSLLGPDRRLVAVSRHLADQMAALAAIPGASIPVIPNVVDFRMFRPRSDVARDPDELLWVGNRKTSKGIDTLIEAMALVGGDRPLRLRMIGSAPTEAEDRRLMGLAASLGVADRVRFEPPASREQVAEAMARAGLFVHPSPSESFGIVAIEALATGLPIVAVAPTIADLIGRDGTLGELAEGPGAAALADAIARAIARIDSFDPAAARAAAAPYDVDRVAGDILAIYRSLAPTAELAGTTAAADALGATDLERGLGGRLGPTLVVGLRRRSALDRLARFPEAERPTLAVVTSAGEGTAPSGFARWDEVDVDAEFRTRLADAGISVAEGPRRGFLRRLLAAASHPLRALRRRRLAVQRPALADAVRAAAIADAARHVPGDGPLVALDADDIVAVRRAGLESRLAPGMLWWIADRRDELD